MKHRWSTAYNAGLSFAGLLHKNDHPPRTSPGDRKVGQAGVGGGGLCDRTRALVAKIVPASPLPAKPFLRRPILRITRRFLAYLHV